MTQPAAGEPSPEDICDRLTTEQRARLGETVIQAANDQAHDAVDNNDHVGFLRVLSWTDDEIRDVLKEAAQ